MDPTTLVVGVVVAVGVVVVRGMTEDVGVDTTTVDDIVSVQGWA